MNYSITFEKKKSQNLASLAIFSILLIVFRIAFTHEVFYGFLIFNLILAAIPFLIGLYLTEIGCASKTMLLAASALWLAFIPNAPYILTDFLHFGRESNIPGWFDTLMLASFSCSGMFFGLVSMADIHKLWNQSFGSKISKIFIVSSCFLSGFGMYLGRFLRYNSWDLLHHPISLITDSFAQLSDLGAIGFSIGYGLFFLLCYNASLKTNNYENIDHGTNPL